DRRRGRRGARARRHGGAPVPRAPAHARQPRRPGTRGARRHPAGRARPVARPRRPPAAGPGMTALQQVVDTLEALPTTAFLVLDRDRVVLDHGATTAPSYLASARKSILSVLYGPAVADGTIRLGATLGELGIDDTGGLLPQERRATVRHLLTSSS